MKIYLQQNGASAGPFEEQSLREQLAQGTLAPDVYAWREGLAEWRPLGEVLADPSMTVPLATLPPMASGGQSTARMPWWAKTLLGCGGLLALVIIAAAASIVFVIYKSEHPSYHPTTTAQSEDFKGAFDKRMAADRADLDKEIAEETAKMKKDQADLQAEIDRATADPEHYTVTKQTDTDGGSTTVVTPKDNTPEGKPITRKTTADGKTITTAVDAEGNTITKTVDSHGNISTVTTPKEKR